MPLSEDEVAQLRQVLAHPILNLDHQDIYRLQRAAEISNENAQTLRELRRWMEGRFNGISKEISQLSKSAVTIQRITAQGKVIGAVLGFLLTIGSIVAGCIKFFLWLRSNLGT